MPNTSVGGVVAVAAIQEKYSFKKKLGKGGYCDVFLAEQKETGRKVAVKMMEMNPGNEKIDRRVERFRREMLLYGQLDHPNIVNIIDSGETETGLLFIIFEYIQGMTLAQILKKEGALSIDRTLALMKQVLAGLHAAHEKGIIHRDLKPENVMVIGNNGSEQIKILDFGISTFVTGQFGDMPRLTATKEFLGTPSYAAPEQLRGEPVSPKVDIFAWGLLFLECMTGKLPFSGTSVASIVQQQLSTSSVPIPTVLIDHRLGTLLRWTLEKDAHRRAGNCAIISSHLENVSVQGIPQDKGFLTGEAQSDGSLQSADIAIYETYTSTQERRQVTVVCFSLGLQESRALQSPEVLDEIYQDLMNYGVTLFQKFGAHVVTDAGDRVLAYFGYPDASDTAARCAARSALELATSMMRRGTVFNNQQGLQLSYRMGIHTGMIHVRKTNWGKSQLSGLTASIVGKLCNAAEVNSIFLTENSFSLLNDFVECNEISNDSVSTLFSNSARVYRVIGERRVEGLGGIEGPTMSPMVGRDGEKAHLVDLWKKVGKKDSGKAILLQGEPGMGKSRLAAEFALAVLQKSAGWIECRCLPEAKNSALYPILEFLKNNLGLRRASSPQQAAWMLENHLKSFGIDVSVAMPLFCSWFGIQNETHAMPALSPQRQKQLVFEYCAEMLVKLARSSQAVIMIEDLHWADPTTLEFIQKLLSRIRESGVMLLMSARPVFAPGWKNHEAEIMILNRLEDVEVEKIIQNIMDSDELTATVIAKIIFRADGIPLFVEEVTRMFREKTDSKDEIPLTLRDLLTGKIDRLGPAKETIQLASVLGRTFDYGLIEKISLKDAASLLADLDQLVSAGLLHARLRIGNPEYVFHHALVCDSAYDSLSSKARIGIHQRIAQTLEKDFPEVVMNQPEEIARHWAAAGEFDKASLYGVQAATHYLIKSLYIESIHHAAESLEWVHKIKDGKVQIERELQLMQLLIPCYISTKGFAAPEINKINSRTEELRGILPKDSPFLTSILWGKVIYYNSTPDYQKFEFYMREALLIGEETDNKDLLSAVYSTKSHFSLSHGAFKDAINYADISIEYYKHKKIESHGTIFGNDSKVLSLCIKSVSLAIYGDIDSANRCMEQAIECAASINEPSSRGLALAYRLSLSYEKNEKHIVEKYCTEFKEVINKYGLESWLNIVELFHSWATGDVEKARQCLNFFQIIVSKQLAPYWNSITAQVEYSRGLYDDCMKRVDEFIKQSYEIGEIFYLPELYRIKALCVAEIAPDDLRRIETNFSSACDFADKIHAHLFKVRALLDWHHAVSNPASQKTCIDQLKKTIDIFSGFKNYREHHEIKEAITLVSPIT